MNTMTGFTLEETERIMNYAPDIFCARFYEEDPNYVLASELYRRTVAKYDAPDRFSLAVGAFALGHALAIREERARLRGEKLEPLPQAEMDKADEAVMCQRERDDYINVIKGLDDNSKQLLLDYLKTLEARPE